MSEKNYRVVIHRTDKHHPMPHPAEHHCVESFATAERSAKEFNESHRDEFATIERQTKDGFWTPIS